MFWRSTVEIYSLCLGWLFEMSCNLVFPVRRLPNFHGFMNIVPMDYVSG